MSTTKTITMLKNEQGADGKPLKAGKSYELPTASADHWLKRKKAVEVKADDAPDDADDDNASGEIQSGDAPPPAPPTPPAPPPAAKGAPAKA